MYDTNDINVNIKCEADSFYLFIFINSFIEHLCLVVQLLFIHSFFQNSPVFQSLAEEHQIFDGWLEGCYLYCG